MRLVSKLNAMRTFSRSLGVILKTSYRLSPTIVWLKGIDTLVSSTLPVATVYLASITTNELVNVYAGVPGARDAVLGYVGLTAVIALVEQGWMRMSDYIRFKTNDRIESEVNLEIYHKYLSLDYWRYEDKETNDLKDRAERFSRFFQQSFESVFGAIGTIITYVVALVAVGYSSPILAVVLLVAFLPTAWVQLQITRLDITWWDIHRERNRMRYAIEHKLSNENTVMDTRTFGLADYFLKRRQEAVDGNLESSALYRRITMRWWFISYIAENSALIFSLLYTVYQIAAQLKPIGHFVFVQSMVLRATGAMSTMVSNFGSIGENIEYFKHYDEFINLPSQHDGTQEIAGPVGSISLKNLSFRYPNATVDALHRVSLEIKRGEHVAIVGENGAGKTTLVRLILGMRAPTRGSVELDGTNLREFVLKTWHDKIGILFQGFDSYHFATIKDNVRFGRVHKPTSDDQVKTALKRARAYDFVQKLPKKEETIASTYYGKEDDSTRLSGGQWQRLAIARVFYREPEVLILDEPTSALDAKAEAEIFDEIHKEMQGKTVIIISHRFSTVRKAHKIVVLDQGRIIESGTHEELMALNGHYHSLFELQAKEYR